MGTIEKMGDLLHQVGWVGCSSTSSNRLTASTGFFQWFHELKKILIKVVYEIDGRLLVQSSKK